MTLPSGLPLALSDNHPPMSRCYWVVTGKFLAGAYPGSPDALQHRQRIETLWNNGASESAGLVLPYGFQCAANMFIKRELSGN